MVKIILHRNNGSGLTYARRYSLLLAYGLSTEDDDGEKFTQNNKVHSNETISIKLVSSLADVIRNKGYTSEYVLGIMSKYRIKRLEELKLEDLPNFKKDLGI